MTAVMAAAPIFDRRRTTRAVDRDRAVLTAAASLDQFTVAQVIRRADGERGWHSTTCALMRCLRDEGHLRVVSPNGVKPYIYEWVEP